MTTRRRTHVLFIRRPPRIIMKTKTCAPVLCAFLAASAAAGCGEDDQSPPGAGGNAGAGASSGHGGKGGGGAKAGAGSGGQSGGGQADAGQSGAGESGAAGTAAVETAGAGGHDAESGAGNGSGGSEDGGTSGEGTAGSGEGGHGGAPEPMCGDSVLTAAESCDDGDSDDGDGCSASCTIERILDKGHIDLFSIVYDETMSQLIIQVKETSELYRVSAAYWEPESVTIDVDSSLTGVGIPDERFSFLGEVGATVYLLPQDGSYQWSYPWPGWETYRLIDSLPDGVEPADTEYPLQVEIEFLETPGAVHTFASAEDELSPPTDHYVDSADPAADILPMSAASHTHTNWAFTKLGDYYFTATPTLTTKTGGTITGPARRFHFHVGTPLVPAETGPTFTVQSNPEPPYTSGDTIELSASFDPPEAAARIEWYRPGQPDQFQEVNPEWVPGAHDTTYRFTATGTPVDYDHFPVLVSASTGRLIAR
jgi:surface-anchored protein